jgi:hypothetical protein
MAKLVLAKEHPVGRNLHHARQSRAPGWVLVTGQWFAPWAALENVRKVEILAGDTIVHHARTNRA